MRISKIALAALAGTVLFAGWGIVAGDAEAAKRRRAQGSATVEGLWHDARIERGFVCYSEHFHYGSSGIQPTRAKAEAAAISSWSSFVDFEYGSAWARYARAGSKQMSCSQSGSGWDCSVEARPCKGR